MKKTWRWFGPNDPITLSMLRQIGVEGIVTALHDVPNGAVWEQSAIAAHKSVIEASGLTWEVVESLPVSEAIKYGGPERDRLIQNYCTSLAHLGQSGITTVCYNFMPVIDWIRTDLHYQWEDGTQSLYFNYLDFAYFDCYILERQGAQESYSQPILEALKERDKMATVADKQRLINTIIVETQSFIDGNFEAGSTSYVDQFKALLKRYQGIDRNQLRANLVYFLQAVMPTCRAYNIHLCIHPDDPPFQVLGLPRIVTNDADIAWLLDAVDDPHNGLTFCAGSLSAGIHNNTIELAQKYASRTAFVHLRSTTPQSNGDFMESSHLTGNGHLVDLIRIFEKEHPELPMRVDHGRLMLDDAEKGYNPGYSFHGRMFALAQVDGMMAVVRDELNRRLP